MCLARFFIFFAGEWSRGVCKQTADHPGTHQCYWRDQLYEWP